MHSEICPVCNGTGEKAEVQCHGCVGKGWIEVRDDSVAIFPYPYVPTPSVPFYIPRQPDWTGPEWVYTCCAAWPEGLRG